VVALGPDAYLDEVRSELVEVGARLLVDSLGAGLSGLPVPEPQVGPATMADKLTPGDLQLHWDQPATEVVRVVHLGRAWTTFRGRRLGVLRAVLESGEVGGSGASGEGPPGTLEGTSVHAGVGRVRLETVQPESRSPMSAPEWVRGARPTVGERLGTE
jgi:methionyl-tRNA formyltransferase